MQEIYKGVLGLILIVVGVILALYFSLVYMLYGGIAQAVYNWGISNPDVIWGIIKACCSELGVLPGYLIVMMGYILITD